VDLTIPQEVINELGVDQIIDIRDQLPVNKKYTWAQLAGSRDLNNLTTIALHHDAIKKELRAGWTDVDAANSIAKTHIKLTRDEPGGEPGMPYHIWIRSGKAYLCNNIEDRTYGIASNNGYTVHVCVSGEYANYDELTDEDRNMLYAVIIALKKALPAYERVLAHNELNPTSCPGYSIKKVREDVDLIENRLAQQETWAAKLTKIGELSNQYNYMFDRIKLGESDGDAQWAMNQLLAVRDVMKERGLL
jgi:hypothetical protein